MSRTITFDKDKAYMINYLKKVKQNEKIKTIYWGYNFQLHAYFITYTY